MTKTIRCKLCKHKPRKLFDLIKGNDWEIEIKCGNCGGISTYSDKDV